MRLPPINVNVVTVAPTTDELMSTVRVTGPQGEFVDSYYDFFDAPGATNAGRYSSAPASAPGRRLHHLPARGHRLGLRLQWIPGRRHAGLVHGVPAASPTPPPPPTSASPASAGPPVADVRARPQGLQAGRGASVRGSPRHEAAARRGRAGQEVQVAREDRRTSVLSFSQGASNSRKWQSKVLSASKHKIVIKGNGVTRFKGTARF